MGTPGGVRGTGGVALGQRPEAIVSDGSVAEDEGAQDHQERQDHYCFHPTILSAFHETLC
jgi:hypothetical protein